VLIAPYLLVFAVFVLYPVTYGLWLARNPASYQTLFDDPSSSARSSTRSSFYWSR
jgi:multiple sugar transport system permease protein